MTTTTTADAAAALTEHAGGYVQTMPTTVLVAAATGALDLTALVRRELASRGLDAQGKWIGFEASTALWAAQGGK